MKKKVGMISLGCPKNLVDSEVILGLIKNNGYEVTNDEKEADIIIVNTCGFIESAKQESINTILEMAGYKSGKCKSLIVTGCLAERYKDEIMKSMPEVDAVVGTGNYQGIADIIEKTLKGEKQVLYGKLSGLEYLDQDRLVSSRSKGYAYLKIAEGCDNRCTYCIIPSLKGSYRSRKIESLLKEARQLVESGAGELILVAQDTTRYGSDIYGEAKLVELIRKLSSIEGLKWIRLLYCYPEAIDDGLINEFAGNPKLCKYIDIPLQHASDRILKLMGRKGSKAELEQLIAKLRDRVHGIVIRTTVIVGFPDETEADFELLYDFVKRHEFDRLGAFVYSKEEDTAAARMKHQVPKAVKNKRYNMIMELQSNIMRRNNKRRENSVYKAIVEGVADDGIFYTGRTYAEAPEIDGQVFFTSHEPLEVGKFVNVRILNAGDYDIIGEVTDESAE